MRSLNKNTMPYLYMLHAAHHDKQRSLWEHRRWPLRHKLFHNLVMAARCCPSTWACFIIHQKRAHAVGTPQPAMRVAVWDHASVSSNHSDRLVGFATTSIFLLQVSMFCFGPLRPHAAPAARCQRRLCLLNDEPCHVGSHSNP